MQEVLLDQGYSFSTLLSNSNQRFALVDFAVKPMLLLESQAVAGSVEQS